MLRKLCICKNDDFIGRIQGIGFFFGEDLEVALCNPSIDLTYEDTSGCIARRKFSKPYKI